MTPTVPQITSLLRQTWPVVFLLLPLLVLAPGCQPRNGMETVVETEEPAFRRGKQLQREGRRQEALSAFLSVIEKRRGNAPESHLEAGELFRTHIQDPIAAIHHYRKFLELSPNSRQAPQVRQLIETATKDFARTLPAQPVESQVDRLDLLDTIERLRRENDDLKRELANARQERDRLAARTTAPAPSGTTTQSAARPAGRPAATTPPAADRPRTHTVVAGDTLSRISSQAYGTSARWNDIYEANRDILPNENSLRIGMVLRIPE